MQALKLGMPMLLDCVSASVSVSVSVRARVRVYGLGLPVFMSAEGLSLRGTAAFPVCECVSV